MPNTKKTTTRKTKEQLLEELNAAKDNVAEVKKQLEKLEQYKILDDAANDIRVAHMALVNAGFSDEQAFELLKITAQEAMSQRFTSSILRR